MVLHSGELMHLLDLLTIPYIQVNRKLTIRTVYNGTSLPLSKTHQPSESKYHGLPRCHQAEAQETRDHSLAAKPFFANLCSYLDASDLFALRQVSKQLIPDLDSHFRIRWNVNRSLKRFVRDPQVLRSIMAQYDALICGSFFIQFLDNVLWKESDLDIFVREEHTDEFGRHLVENEGYRSHTRSPHEEPYSYDNVKVLSEDPVL